MMNGLPGLNGDTQRLLMPCFFSEQAEVELSRRLATMVLSVLTGQTNVMLAQCDPHARFALSLLSQDQVVLFSTVQNNINSGALAVSEKAYALCVGSGASMQDARVYADGVFQTQVAQAVGLLGTELQGLLYKRVHAMVANLKEMLLSSAPVPQPQTAPVLSQQLLAQKRHAGSDSSDFTDEEPGTSMKSENTTQKKKGKREQDSGLGLLYNLGVSELEKRWSAQVLVGERVQIQWEAFWYPCRVKGYSKRSGISRVVYETSGITEDVLMLENGVAKSPDQEDEFAWRIPSETENTVADLMEHLIKETIRKDRSDRARETMRLRNIKRQNRKQGPTSSGFDAPLEEEEKQAAEAFHVLKDLVSPRACKALEAFEDFSMAEPKIKKKGSKGSTTSGSGSITCPIAKPLWKEASSSSDDNIVFSKDKDLVTKSARKEEGGKPRGRPGHKPKKAELTSKQTNRPIANTKANTKRRKTELEKLLPEPVCVGNRRISNGQQSDEEQVKNEEVHLPLTLENKPDQCSKPENTDVSEEAKGAKIKQEETSTKTPQRKGRRRNELEKLLPVPVKRAVVKRRRLNELEKLLPPPVTLEKSKPEDDENEPITCNTFIVKKDREGKNKCGNAAHITTPRKKYKRRLNELEKLLPPPVPRNEDDHVEKEEKITERKPIIRNGDHQKAKKAATTKVATPKKQKRRLNELEKLLPSPVIVAKESRSATNGSTTRKDVPSSKKQVPVQSHTVERRKTRRSSATIAPIAKSRKKRTCTEAPPVLNGNRKDPFGQEAVGRRLRVFWPLEKRYFSGIVKEFSRSVMRYLVKYDDGDVEWISFEKELLIWEV